MTYSIAEMAQYEVPLGLATTHDLSIVLKNQSSNAIITNMKTNGLWDKFRGQFRAWNSGYNTPNILGGILQAQMYINA